MGYIVGLFILIVVVPLLFLLLSRRTRGAGGAAHGTHDRGVTVSRPSSDQPTPGAGTINQPAPGADQRLPPG